ncbi:hypothetical protein CcaverHIS631_0400740 [Cutaneotrichosporon cavernicola]|nr:hypothetical protein CcaverHIS631_0400740 [Cutaneotrichosporon cavernicola]BEJ06805.1 hypothetical protein CcaverHIS641_0400740 [Cutaneotrichosporon cavernicola]
MATKIPFNTDKWGPLDAKYPLKGEVQDGGASLKHISVGGTDWWRTTGRHSMDGPVHGFWHEVGGGIEVSVELTVDPKVQYDQATLLLYVSPTQWVKAGIEFDDGALWNGAVVCNPYSDWSKTKRRPADSARYTISYSDNLVQIYLGDDMIRQVKWFGPTRNNDADKGTEGQDKVFVGVMSCSPKAGGADITWRDFTLKQSA